MKNINVLKRLVEIKIFFFLIDITFICFTFTRFYSTLLL